MSISRMIYLWVGDGKINVSDGILGNGDDRGDNGDGGGDESVGAAAYSTMRALMDAGKGGWVGQSFVPYGDQSEIMEQQCVKKHVVVG
uniref:Uncharacterized protein n=1 Tax=Tanacetum cinerariifolium TaxID=118510 RepID=A0A6L2K6E1_TANCI|nr:hypothetical protein [Tanacetum cinerariifolium]